MKNGPAAISRIHGELLKLGFTVSEITVSRYMPRRPADSDQLKRWIAFLHNQKDAIAAMDFFTVPTVSLKVLYVFVVIEHGRRRVVHCNATFYPTSAWVIQQLREAFPYDTAPNVVASQRDATIRAIDAGGRRRWEHESGYTRRSLVETAMSRYKAIIGDSIRSRTMVSQKVEATLACAIMNRKTQLGMPDGYCIA